MSGVLYYALGGGLGHVTRARAVLHTLGLESGALILVSSPEAAAPRFAGRVPVKLVPADLACDATACRNWLVETIAAIKPSALFLDAFPAGIAGEFTEFVFPASLPVHHVARLISAPALASIFARPCPRFATVHLVEELLPAHHRWLAERTDNIRPLTLLDPPAPAVFAPPPAHPYWLVVHSGPIEEVDELLGYATDLRTLAKTRSRIHLVAPHPPSTLPPNTTVCTRHPADALFADAERIIGGGGFNFMRQTAPFRTKTHYLPFPRRYDDQYLRVARVTSR
jgi:hypothetical protein